MTLPNSLPTVTVLVKVAELFYWHDVARGRDPMSAEAYISYVIRAHGYEPADDTDGLRDIAARELTTRLS